MSTLIAEDHAEIARRLAMLEAERRCLRLLAVETPPPPAPEPTAAALVARYLATP